jgi:hypothetical protein
MPKILFDQTRITKSELLHYEDLIHKIISRSLRHPNVKKLAGTKYNNEDVYRAKIDKKNRLIYTYISLEGQKTLLVLALNDHNYGQVKRQLLNKNPNFLEVLALEDDVYKDTPEPTTGELALLPAVSYNKLTLALDDSQQAAMQQKTPLILNGPPGAGKTVILYNLMIKILNLISIEMDAEKSSEEAKKTPSAPVLFVSQSDNLVNSLKTQYEASKPVDTVEVQFTTWASLLKKHQPECQLIKEEQFVYWLKEHFNGSPSNVVHYELSLIAALGAKKYMELGNRQCYFSKTPEVQKKLVDLLTRWQEYLKKHKLLDPMVSRLNLPKELKYPSIFCDEAQNLPPVALCDLVEHAEDQHFVACLDSEQCLINSPYIHSCLKELMHINYGTYTEQPLPKTWRCPPKVAAAANVLMQLKYRLDGGGKRRNYNTIESMHASGGMVTWVNNEGLVKVREFGALAGTVVIAEHLEPGERENIIKHLGTNNILTAREAIGLDFDRVILWKPLSNTSCFHQLVQKIRKPDNSELTLEQWNALNALYVSITRSQSEVFIYEINNHWREIGEHFFGTLPLNQHNALLNKTNIEKEYQKWQQTVEHHLAEGRESLAIDLMKFHLHMSHDAIEDKIYSLRNIKKESNIPPSTTMPPKPEGLHQKSDSGKKETLKQSADPAKPKINMKSEKKHAATKNKSAVLNDSVSHTKKVAPSKTDSVLVASKIDSVKPSKVSLINDYISKLLTQLNEKNINNLFNHKSALRYLFEHQLEDGTCLFTKLVNNSAYLKLVLKNIKQHWSSLSPGLTPKVLCQSNPPDDTPSILILASSAEGCAILNMVLNSHTNKSKEFSLSSLTHIPKTNPNKYPYASAIQSLISFIDGRKFLIKLLELNPDLAKNLDDDFLNIPPVPAGSTVKIIPPIYWIASSPTGIKLFKKLSEHNPFFGKSLTTESLNSVRIKQNSSESGSSALYWLLSYCDGREIVSKLLDSSPEFAKKITAKELCRPLDLDAGSIAHTSALYFLLSNPDGRILFEKILKCNPEIAKGITGAALCRQRIKTAEIPNQFSPLSHATTCTLGLRILNKLLDINPDIAKTIGADAICHIFNANANNIVDPSILFSLSSSNDGKKFLLRLIDANPELAKGITGRALCQPVDIKSLSNYGISPLYWFSCSDIGRVLINKFIDSNPNLAMEITAQDLCQKLSASSLYPGTSTLLWLCGNALNRTFLKKLIELNPQIAREITEEALCSISESKNENDINTSPLFWLCCMSDGRELFNQILDLNPELGKNITGKILCLARPPHVKILANVAPLFWLLIDSAGIKALTKILARNPALTAEINGQDLCLVRPPDSMENSNTSPLFFLAKDNDGQMLLHLMLTSNPQLAKTVTAHALYLNIGSNQERLSPFYWFCSAPLGRINLKNLISNNPELVNELSSEILTFKRCNGRYHNTSPFSWLVSCTDGLTVLNMLLDKKPELAQGISDAFLREKCAISNVDETQDSPLGLLLKSAHGQNTLNRLINLNPSLISVIQSQDATRPNINDASVVHINEPTETDTVKASQLGIFAHESNRPLSNNNSTDANQNLVNSHPAVLPSS